MSEKVTVKHISIHKGKTPDDSPGYLMWRVSIKWRSEIEKILKSFDLTHPQFVVLAVTGWLTRDGNDTSQIAVSKMSGLDPNTTSQVLRGIEKKGLITRMQNIDERSKCPALTSQGAKILKKALPAVERADQEFFAKLKSGEEKTLIGFFQRLYG